MTRLLLSLLICAAGSGALAGDASMGQHLFEAHCSACHGQDATGGGPLAAALTTAPPDLTRLADANGGVFPADYVLRRIDGSERLLSHGDPMPVFTHLFDGPSTVFASPEGQDIAAPELLVNLVSYLEVVQR